MLLPAAIVALITEVLKFLQTPAGQKIAIDDHATVVKWQSRLETWFTKLNPDVPTGAKP